MWAAVGLAIALPAVTSADPDSRLIIGVVSVVLPLAAALAAVAISGGRYRLAGLLLLLSVATPTYFLWVVNIPALIVGCGLVIRGRGNPRRARDPWRSGSSAPAS
ncbi:MAG: hypothetical protein QOE57_3189 [Acidimicrobiaceae bacterium]|nr:hypothetical protein [Acidimicrobiaceae bacterium]